MTTIPLHILQLQFKCQLLDDLFCPADKLGNTLRGAFGMAFKRLSCVKSGGCEGYCTGECLYGQVFEPKITNGPGPSGLVDPPRPFVFVPMPHASVYKAGDFLDFSINIFGEMTRYYPQFIEVFRILEVEGLGAHRSRFRIKLVLGDCGDGRTHTVYSQSNAINSIPEIGVYRPRITSVHEQRFRFDFLMPAQIKANGRTVREPSFGDIFRRLRDRISAIMLFYENSNFEARFQQLGALADGVTTTAKNWTWHENARVSSRTKLSQNLSGVKGWAEFDTGTPENLNAFLPWLELGQYVNVGKTSTWGMGRFKISLSKYN